jgi:hypothetical protein
VAVHELKVWPRFFDAIASGDKTFEARKDDRPEPFRAGDTLVLREWAPPPCDSDGLPYGFGFYTGRELRRTVTYLLTGRAFGIERGHVVMAIKPEVRPWSSVWLRT